MSYGAGATIDTLTPVDPAWAGLLARLRHDVYHTAEYTHVEAERIGASAEAFVADDGERLLFVPYLVRRCDDAVEAAPRGSLDVISAYGYPGPLISEAAAQAPEFVEAATRRLIQALRVRGVCSAFLRLHPILDGFRKAIDVTSLTINTSPTVSVDLTKPESIIWAHTRRGHQSTINKCKRLGFTARIVPYLPYANQFLEIYRQTLNHALANPAYYFDRKYFDDLQSLGEGIHLCIVEAEQEIVAGCMLFECCGIVQAHLGGTRPDYRDRSPFSLLLHHARLWAKARGNEVFHLGGGLGGAEDRIFSFKAGFSRQRHIFETLRLIIDPLGYDELVRARALQIRVAPEQLLRSPHFPAYRSMPSTPVPESGS